MTLALRQSVETSVGEIAFDVFGDGPPVVLVHGTPSRAAVTPQTRKMQREIERYDPLPDAELEASIRQHLSSATSRPLDAQTFDALFAQWEGAEGQALYLRNLACLHESDTQLFESLLPSISVPVLVLWGERDAWLPVATSERIGSLIPNARRVVIPRAGHFSMEDEPNAIAEELSAFVA